MGIVKSNYQFKITDDILHIEDLNYGGKSVTNNIENVINEIKEMIGDKIKKCHIIYKDSEGIWDGIKPLWGINKCVEVDFYHIGETEFELALEKINR